MRALMDEGHRLFGSSEADPTDDDADDLGLADFETAPFKPGAREVAWDMDWVGKG